METQTSPVPPDFRDRCFEYTFPFEGNGNCGSRPGNFASSFSFEYTFPFEGNGNITLFLPIVSVLFSTFEYTFPFEGNGNLIISMRCSGSTSLNTLSRLKGMETYSVLPSKFRLRRFEYTFPFEGNGNKGSFVRSLLRLWFSLNTLSRLKGMETYPNCWIAPQNQNL